MNSIIFEYQNYRIRFKAPLFIGEVYFYKKWDEGYLVVMAKYAHRSESEEEYIDLVPILENLYISPKEFLKPIKEVRLENAWYCKIPDAADLIVNGYAFTRCELRLSRFEFELSRTCYGYFGRWRYTGDNDGWYWNSNCERLFCQK